MIFDFGYLVEMSVFDLCCVFRFWFQELSYEYEIYKCRYFSKPVVIEIEIIITENLSKINSLDIN
jgi:hypothetical protein